MKILIVTLKLKNNTLERCIEFRLIAVVIDEFLSFDYHVNYISKMNISKI